MRAGGGDRCGLESKESVRGNVQRPRPREDREKEKGAHCSAKWMERQRENILGKKEEVDKGERKNARMGSVFENRRGKDWSKGPYFTVEYDSHGHCDAIVL